MPKAKKTKLNKAMRKLRVSAPPKLQRQPVDYGTHESMLVGLTDPFSPEAQNAQYPDSGAGKSHTFQQRFSLYIGTDVNGAAGVAINPKVNFPILYFSSSSGTTITWAGTWSAVGDASSNLVNTYGRSYRPTSYGIRIANTLSATDAKGYLIIAKGGIPPALPSSTTYLPSNFTEWDTHPYSHGGEWHAVGVPKSANAYDMKDLATFNTNSAAGDDTWETIYVGLFGAPASAGVGYIEFVFNYEYVTKEDAVIAQLARPQPTLNIQMQTAINHVQSQHPASHRGPQQAVKNFIKREGKKALLKHVIPFVTKKAVAALV